MTHAVFCVINVFVLHRKLAKMSTCALITLVGKKKCFVEGKFKFRTGIFQVNADDVGIFFEVTLSSY